MKWRGILLPLLIGISSFLLFLFFQTTGIYGGDSGDLVTAAATFGVPHPPGFPLYTFLGWLLTRLPFFTPAWSVGLLSSLPHALTLVFVFFIVHRLTKDGIAALFSCAVLAGNYLFFLYSVTPEVFGLLDVFIVLLIYLLMGWGETGRTGYLYLAAVIFGFALGHHQLILFLVPAGAYFIGKQRNALQKKKNKPNTVSFIKLLGFIILGLTPYLYVMIAAHGDSIINWDRPTSLPRLLHLILRLDYGTFVTNNSYGVLLVNRMLQLVAYAKFILTDMTSVGIALVLCGLYWLYRNQRVIGYWLSFSLITIGPAFFFYAGYPLANNFTLGTYERFLLPSYVLLSIIVGFGLVQLQHIVGRLCDRFTTPAHGRTIVYLVVIVFFAYPLTMLSITVWRFWGIGQDRTADNLGVDILATTTPQSLILLNRDTPLFITQYVRYAALVRPDTIVLHISLLGMAPYLETIGRVFPEVHVPALSDAQFVETFVVQNYQKFPLYTIAPFVLSEGWFWVPEGLLYRLYERNNLPNINAFIARNKVLWQSYHDPNGGILSRYDHLMLSDVRSVYAKGKIAEGNVFMKAGRYAEAKEAFVSAVSYKSDAFNEEAYTLLGLVELYNTHCDAARDAFRQARQHAIVPEKEVFLYEASAEKMCGAPGGVIDALYQQYRKRRELGDIPLAR